MLGKAYGILWRDLLPSMGLTPPAFALVGMAAVLGGAIRAPLTAALLAFEMTGDTRIILPCCSPSPSACSSPSGFSPTRCTQWNCVESQPPWIFLKGSDRYAVERAIALEVVLESYTGPVHCRGEIYYRHGDPSVRVLSLFST